MSGIRSKNTKPEIVVRKALHRRGYRYRLHNGALPGKPDLVFPSRKAVIFVNGCFWHGHGCHLFRWPSTREEFWKAKILRNRERDSENRSALTSTGWRTLVVWECALKGKNRKPPEVVTDLISEWLEGHAAAMEISGVSG